MTNKKNVWQTLAWKDEAGRHNEMTGPASSLKDQVAALKKDDVEYSLEDLGYIEEVMGVPAQYLDDKE